MLKDYEINKPVLETDRLIIRTLNEADVHACNNGERQSKMMENEPMNAEEKKRDLYLRQKELLDTFLEHGAISRAQYDKSLGDLTEKMGMEPKV